MADNYQTMWKQQHSVLSVADVMFRKSPSLHECKERSDKRNKAQTINELGREAMWEKTKQQWVVDDFKNALNVLPHVIKSHREAHPTQIKIDVMLLRQFYWHRRFRDQLTTLFREKGFRANVKCHRVGHHNEYRLLVVDPDIERRCRKKCIIL